MRNPRDSAQIQLPQGIAKSASVAGHSTAYWEYGNPSGIPVVLIHGFRGDHHGLERIAEGLPKCRVIVPDLPGFGQTAAFTTSGHTLAELGKWLVEFTNAVLSGEFVLVGHSFGTLVVAEALAQGAAPHDVVLINPISSPALKGPRALMSQLALWYYNLADALPTRAGNALLRNKLIVRVMSNTMAKTKDIPLREWIHDQHDQHFSSFHDRASLNEMFRESVSTTVHDFVQHFRMPTWIIAAELDDITPLDEQLRLRNRIPESTLTVVPRVGHLVHYEAPVEASESIAAVANRLTRSENTRSKTTRSGAA